MQPHKKEQLWKGTVVAILAAATSAIVEAVVENITSGEFDPSKEESWTHLAASAGTAALLAVAMYFKGPPRNRSKRERRTDTQQRNRNQSS